MSLLTSSRTRIALLFLLGLGLAQWRASTQVTAPEEIELARCVAAQGVLRELLDKSDEMLGAAEKLTVRDVLVRLNQAITGGGGTAVVLVNSQAQITRAVYLFERNSAVERVWANGGEVPVERSWPSASGLLLLRLGVPGMDGDNAPQFVYREVDLNAPGELKLDRARASYLVMWLKNGRPGRNQAVLPVVAGGKEIARLRVTVNVPELGRLKVAIVEGASGQATAAVVGLYAADHRLMVPAEAISFDNAGFVYRAGQVRAYYSMHYWPGTPEEQHVFFVEGGFSLSVPAGRYKLIVGKGFEYRPVTRVIDVAPGGEAGQTVELGRWVDMPAQGWHSGDGHVHYARGSEEANRPLLAWARAEDVHMINVVRMGDALKTYFEQYAFGQAGRKLVDGYALVPGQEDPRTDNIGHTLHMNLRAPIRYPEGYYLYDKVFDETHRQGGLSGYAHAYQPPRMSFWVRENMTLNIPREKVDFAEISEFGDIDTDVYYEFLNLGFKLTASAGSDVPWGHSIGTSRVYAYTGKPFDADEWFAAVKAGRTFVTTGPMLDLKVNGERPGAELRVKAGEKLRVEATASGLAVAPKYLELVEQGDVVKAAARTGNNLALSTTLEVRHSTWIAARCAGAHTSPVYIRVGDEPTWKRAAVPELIRIRLEQLDAIEALTRKGVGPGGQGNWNNPDGFRQQTPELLERVKIAREIYRKMLARATGGQM